MEYLVIRDSSRKEDIEVKCCQCGINGYVGKLAFEMLKPILICEDCYSKASSCLEF